MIVQNELAYNPFGHGDLHAIPCPGLQQADTRPLFNFYKLLSRSENVILKTMCVLTNPFLDSTVFASVLAFFELCERTN